VPFTLIPFLLLALPALEITVFIIVGSQIGVLPTLMIVVATAIAGAILLRIQGFGVLRQIRQTLDQGKMPGRELVHGVMILAAGILLLTPGLVTDTLGFLLFIPPVRDLVWKMLRSRIVIIGGGQGASPGPRRRPDGHTIDLDAEDYSARPDDSSPWRGPRTPLK
jgi:UPF0716 protein FxsA